VQSVEIRDVRIPQALENAMSQQAQAERERQARVILGEAEVQVSEQFAEASRVYNDNPGALHLRGMNMLYEAIREKGAMVIVPSSAIETMGLGGTLATTAMAKQQWCRDSIECSSQRRKLSHHRQVGRRVARRARRLSWSCADSGR
jgi:regulator of protease activity HflC (stomatin/prohibitin superfamily)